MTFHTADPSVFIADAGDFLDLMASFPADVFVVDSSRLTPGFFDLKTGIAGEILQKCSNYRKRLVILGDFSAVESTSLRQFIGESNRGGQVVFAESTDSAQKWLR